MSEPAKKSKSLFNSFTRIHRLATLGGVSIAAWFSSQIIQRGSHVTESSPMSQEASEMTMKTIPSEEVALRAMPTEDMVDTMMQSTPVMQTDPIIQILWSTVLVLGVIVAGLVIEVIISKRYNSNLIKST